ncbi:MAG: NigD-like N-terminal domain-containing protein [Bacteroidales bacterium]|nr:NigD-like N-terminal domain-containing protein [Bacteroidales bacterium]
MKKIDGKLKKKDLVLSRLLMAALALFPALYSCSNEFEDMDMISDMTSTRISSLQNDILWANAIVTVRTATSGRDYFQLDENTTLEPVGWKNPFSGEVRALVAYSDLDRRSAFCTRCVTVERLDSIVTSDAAYIDIDDSLSGGSDTQVVSVNTGFGSVEDMFEASRPVEVVTSEGIPDWLTFSEDGYLMIHFATFWGDVTAHSVNLYASRKHPDHLYLVHKDNGDYQSYWKESLVAFRICQLYMSRKDEYKDPTSVVLHWMSFGGEKTLRLQYGNRATEK